MHVATTYLYVFTIVFDHDSVVFPLGVLVEFKEKIRAEYREFFTGTSL